MLAAAACLALLVGLAHSVLGEKLIFSRMREDGCWIPTRGEPILLERHVRILWACWHIVTVFGWALGVILLWPAEARLVVIAGMLASSALVLVGTKGRHPGWIGLLGVAVLAWLA